MGDELTEELGASRERADEGTGSELVRDLRVEIPSLGYLMADKSDTK